MSSSSPARRAPESRWLHGPVWDLLVGCGGWSLPLVLGASAVAATHRIELGAAFYFLAVFCNNPHYMATIYRAYGGKRDFSRYKLFSLYLTALVLAAGAVAHLLPGFAPWLFTIYLIWSPWHYTGQNFGIAQMMTRRAGIAPSRGPRNLIYASYLGSYLVWVVDLLDTAPSGSIALSIDFPNTLALGLRLLGYAVYIAGGLAGFVLLSRHARRATDLLAPGLLHVSQFLWFLLPGIANLAESRSAPATYYSAGALAFMHCAQYLWITSYYAKRENSQPGASGQPWRPGRYFATLVIGGIALFTPGPWIVSTVFRHDLFESALIFTALVNIHHFMLDGAIWKLRDGRIARLLLGSAQPNADDQAERDARPELLRWLASPRLAAKVLRQTVTVGLLALAAADQLQSFLTRPSAPPSQVALAQRLNPRDSRVSLRLAQQSLAAGDADAAMAILSEARARSPRNLAILHLLAGSLLQSGSIETAARIYEEALKVAPADLSALTNLGLIAESRGDWRAAATYFERALRADPDRWQTRLHLARGLDRSGAPGEAVPHYEAYLALVRADPAASDLPEVLEASRALARCYEQSGNAKAARELREAIRTLRQ